MRSRWFCLALSALLCLVPAVGFAESAKAGAAPAITLEEYFNAVGITDAKISPDGTAAVIATESPDWKANNYRRDLWLWTAKEGLKALTHSGSEERPEWSPDGKWIAFVSDRALPNEEANAEGRQRAMRRRRIGCGLFRLPAARRCLCLPRSWMCTRLPGRRTARRFTTP